VVGGQAAAAHHLPELIPSVPAADPAVVFLEACRELEVAARDAGPAAQVMAATPVSLIRGLASRGQVPGEAVRIAEDLRRVTNEVAHSARRLEPVDAETWRSLPGRWRPSAAGLSGPRSLPRLAFRLPPRPDSVDPSARRHPAAVMLRLGAGSCHPPWAAVTASASGGPHEPRR
jgi:hypothetical protein